MVGRCSVGKGEGKRGAQLNSRFLISKIEKGLASSVRHTRIIPLQLAFILVFRNAPSLYEVDDHGERLGMRVGKTRLHRSNPFLRHMYPFIAHSFCVRFGWEGG